MPRMIWGQSVLNPIFGSLNASSMLDAMFERNHVFSNLIDMMLPDSLVQSTYLEHFTGLVY